MSSVNELLQSLGEEALKGALIDWIHQKFFVLEGIAHDVELEQLGAEYAAFFEDFYEIALALVMLADNKVGVNENLAGALDEGSVLQSRVAMDNETPDKAQRKGDTAESVEQKMKQAMNIAKMFKAQKNKRNK